MKIFNSKNNFVILLLFSFLFSSSNISYAEQTREPVLVVDRCPEFCPPGIKGPTLVIDRCPEFCFSGLKGPIKENKICAQVLIPVPGRPGYWYTDSCKKNIIGQPSKNKKCLYGVIDGRGYMPTIECAKNKDKEKEKNK
jgi:hypothetical protein